MPISSSVKPLLQARHLWFSLLFLLAPLFFYGQTLTGLWTGALHNDSNSVRKDQSFEIALTEYRGKVFGYSRSEFIVNDTLYYIVKRVKGTIEGDICEVKDDEIIAYNFRGKLDKGIKVTSTFRRNQTDSTWHLDGEWKTNATKKYYAITGKVKLSEEKDLSVSKLFPHLEELNKADEMAFYKERTEPAPYVKVAKPERIESEMAEKPALLAKNEEISPAVKKPELPRPIQPSQPEAIAQTTAATPKADNKPQEAAAATAQANATAVTTEKNVANKESTPVSVEKTAVLPENQVKKPENAPVLANAEKPAPVTNTNPDKAGSDVARADLPKQHSPAANTQPVKEPVKAPVAAPQTAGTKPVVEKAVTKTNNPVVNPAPIKESPSSVAVTKLTGQKPAETVSNTSRAPNNSTNNPVIVNASSNPVSNKAVLDNPVVTDKPAKRIIDPAALLVKKSVEDPIKKSTVIAGRKSEFSQEVYFKSDSLILTLYDNGEIDGDTVSVYLNGEVVMPSQGLKSSAIRKTIHMDDGLETFTLVMFAESLGKYPPNTGLLVIRDGNDVYNLRFSSDFQKSSGIVFRRKQ